LSSEDIEDFSGFTIRLAEWQGVRHALARAPIFGYGGNAQAELEKSYDEIGFVLGQKNRYNAHSMYYQSLLEGGWTGFFVLLLFILGMLTYAIRNRDPLLFAAVLFFALSGLTESLIDRQKGVLFAAVILPILAASFDARSLQSGQRKS
jgi:O-antigen ligase